jgi:hypothetical protein
MAMSIRNRLGSRLPFDVLACALLIGGSGLVFLVVGLVRFLSEGGFGILEVPIIVFVLQLGAAIAMLTGFRLARPVIVVLVVLVALMHMVIALDNGFAWTRVASGVLAAANVYALVLCNTRPVRAHFGLDTDD